MNRDIEVTPAGVLIADLNRRMAEMQSAIDSAYWAAIQTKSHGESKLKSELLRILGPLRSPNRRAG